MRTPVLTIIACLLSSGCGAPDKAALDPSDDAHCSVLAFYFDGLARHQNAPAAQRRAINAVHEWYAARVRAVAVERWGKSGYAQEVGPILDRIKADPAAMRDELEACTDRAIADPAFETFARNLRAGAAAGSPPAK